MSTIYYNMQGPIGLADVPQLDLGYPAAKISDHSVDSSTSSSTDESQAQESPKQKKKHRAGKKVRAKKLNSDHGTASAESFHYHSPHCCSAYQARTTTELTDSPIYEIRPCAKGLGIFAIREIPSGTRLIEEPHLLAVPNAKYQGRSLVYETFKQLDAETQAKVHALQSFVGMDNIPQHVFQMMEYYVKKKAAEDANWQGLDVEDLKQHSAILSKFANNTFVCEGLLGDAWTEAIFEQTSRINHSCVPNAMHAFNVDTSMATVHAVKDIKAGEEITISYIGSYKSAERKASLLNWGFECDCEVCDVDSTEFKASAMRREKMRELYEPRVMAAFGFADLSGRNGVQEMLTLAALLETEGISGVELSDTYHEAARLAAYAKQLDVAQLCAKEALKVDRRCYGDDHPRTRATLKLALQLQPLSGTITVSKLKGVAFRDHMEAVVAHDTFRRKEAKQYTIDEQMEVFQKLMVEFPGLLQRLVDAEVMRLADM